MGEVTDDGTSGSLGALTAAFGAATTVEGVADALTKFALPALGGCAGVLALLNHDGTEFFCPRIVGYPADVVSAWRRFPADGRLPIAEAVRDGRPVLLESLERRLAYYPPGANLPPPVGRALAAVPFREGDVVGGLGVTFPDDRVFGPGALDRLEGVARLCAAALARVRRDGLGCEVLVVDDEPAVLNMLDFALRCHAFAVRRAGGGEEAVEAYRRHRDTTGLVLLDVRMPGLDGPQTLARLREIDPGVRCVFMSGHTGAYTAEQLLALGAARVLQKPFAGMDALVLALREAGRR